MLIPLAHLDPVLVEEVPLDLWRQVFDAVGWPASLRATQESITHAAVLESITRDDPTDGLLQLLEVLQSLGTEDGADAIQAALGDQRIQRDALPLGISNREMALHLFLAQRENAALAEVLARAQIQVQQQGGHRRYHEFFGGAPSAVRQLLRSAAALEEATLTYCRSHDLGDHVQVRAYDDDGAYVFQVLRSHRAQKPLAVVSGHSARATIQYHPVHGDVLRYEAAHGRLRIAARAVSIVDFYRRTLGRILFDDEEFFAQEPVCSLRVLQEQGRAVLDRHDMAGIGQVRMTECLWERGDRELLHLRAPDCFRQIEELGLPLTEGVLLQAKLKLDVIGQSTRPVTVSIRIPGRIDISQPRHEALVDRFLAQIGIRGTPSREATPTLWSLAPWRHPLDMWRCVFGRDTDLLIERGVLRRISLERVSSPESRVAGNTLQAVSLPSGEHYGVSTEPDFPSRTLTATDLDGFELQPERFARELRSRLGVSGAVVPSIGDDSVLELGTVKAGEHSVYLAYAIRRPAPGVLDRLRRRAGGAHVALLCPSADLPAIDGPLAPLDGALPTRAQAYRAAIMVTGLDDVVPAVFSAPDDAQLVVDMVRGQVWLDGVPIPGLKEGTHPFRFVARLAQAMGRPVASLAIKEEISGARQDEDTATRQAKSKANALIREAMAAAGREGVGDPFPKVSPDAYRCALPCFVRHASDGATLTASGGQSVAVGL